MDNRWQNGIPRIGRKTYKANKILDLIPAGSHLVDVFGGGGCVTLHALAKGQWGKITYNELSPHVYRLVDELIFQKKQVDLEKLCFTTREQFKAVLAKPESEYTLEDEIIRLFLSFGYCQSTFLFGKKIFQQRMLATRALLYGDSGTELDTVYAESRKQNTLSGKHSVWLKWCRDNGYLEQRKDLKQIENLQQIERLQQIENLQQIERKNLDYRELKIKPDDIVYCDPPYVGTNTYDDVPPFDEDEFVNWYMNCPAKEIYISEYTVLPGTELVADLGNRCSFAATKAWKNELLLKVVR